MSSKVVLDNYRDWFGRKKQVPTTYQLEDLSREEPIDIRKLEHATRLADQIEEHLKNKIEEIASVRGEDEFVKLSDTYLGTVGRLSNSRLIDAILASDTVNAKQKWDGKPMYYVTLATLLRLRF
jgi:hypothetical protein